MRGLCILVSAGLVATASAGYSQASATDAVIGQVLDEEAKPVAGAEVTARYQSNSGGVSISRSVRTDRQGRYRIDLRQPPGVWTAHATVTIVTDGSAMKINLEPDSDAPFAGNSGAVRNFRLKFAEQTPDEPYGTGGMVVVETAIGDYTPLDEVILTLHPVDGGAAILRKLRNTGEGWVVTGLRPQSYRVSASHAGRPMLISAALTPQRQYSWQTSLVGGFERAGPGIYQMRLEVRGR